MKIKDSKNDFVHDDDDDDDDNYNDDDLEDDEAFAEAMKGSTRTGSSKETSNTAKNDESLARKKGETKKDEICKYYRRGICRHGLSGNKEVEGKICTRIHP